VLQVQKLQIVVYAKYIWVSWVTRVVSSYANAINYPHVKVNVIISSALWSIVLQSGHGSGRHGQLNKEENDEKYY